MNLGELISICEQKSGFNDSAYRPRWTSFLNEAIREFSRRFPWDGLEDTVDLKTDGTEFLILPHYVDTVVGILNFTDIVPVDRGANFDREATAQVIQGTGGQVRYYDRAGEVPVTKDPSGYLWFASTHASDNLAVHITGLVANSGASGALERTFKNLSLNATGTSPLTLTTLFAKIFSISKATDTNGDFYFFDAGASNAHRAYMAAFETESKFKRLRLLYKPEAGKTLQLRFRYVIPPLREDEQSPHPSVKPDFITQKALAIHYGEQEQLQKAQITDANATRLLDAEINKDENFSEPWSQISPFDVPDDFDRGL